MNTIEKLALLAAASLLSWLAIDHGLIGLITIDGAQVIVIDHAEWVAAISGALLVLWLITTVTQHDDTSEILPEDLPEPPRRTTNRQRWLRGYRGRQHLKHLD